MGPFRCALESRCPVDIRTHKVRLSLSMRFSIRDTVTKRGLLKPYFAIPHGGGGCVRKMVFRAFVDRKANPVAITGTLAGWVALRATMRAAVKSLAGKLGSTCRGKSAARQSTVIAESGNWSPQGDWSPPPGFDLIGAMRSRDANSGRSHASRRMLSRCAVFPR